MRDMMTPVSGNKMLELKAEIHDLREQLKATDDPEKIKAIKKLISEKDTYYNILADKARM